MADGTKERILETALALFAQRGYLGTSMNHIACQLGRKRQIMGRIEVPCEVCQNIHETHRDSPGVSVSFRYRRQQSPTLTGSAGECR